MPLSRALTTTATPLVVRVTVADIFQLRRNNLPAVPKLFEHIDLRIDETVFGCVDRLIQIVRIMQRLDCFVRKMVNGTVSDVAGDGRCHG